MRTWSVIAAALLALTLAGCAGGSKQVPTTASANATARATRADTTRTVHPPLVPVGVDTSFVVGADSLYGIVLDDGRLAALAADAAELARAGRGVDTLAAVTRFVRSAADSAGAFALTAGDSLVVGGLLLRADAPSDPTAAAALQVEQWLQTLDDQAARADSLGTTMAAAGDAPTRRAAAAETRTAVADLDVASRALRARLLVLLDDLGADAMAADSARVQQEVAALVRAYGGELDDAINVVGRVAQGIGPATLTPEALRGLAATLDGQAEALGHFDAQWQQFRETGSLNLGDPDRPFQGRGLADLLNRMRDDLAYLANKARNRASAIAAAGDIRGELQARREAETYLLDTQRALVELKQLTSGMIANYRRATTGYWEERLTRAAKAQEERQRLYEQLDELVRREGADRIRADAELLATYRRLSDRLIARRRARLHEVAAHDDLRLAARENLAGDLAQRARVLGERDDYLAAAGVWRELAADRPGEPAPAHRLATLAYQQTTEPWAATAVDSLRDATRREAARCEEIVLQRHAFQQAMNAARDVVIEAAGATAPPAPAASTASAATRPALARLAAADSTWYYPRHAARALDDLGALELAAADPGVRGWLLSLDVLRRRLAFDAGDGDGFLYRYARQTVLDTTTALAEARRVLRYWSWDDGHLDLRRTWTRVSLLPDTTTALATAKRDSVAAVLAAVRTPGARRAVGWALAALDFEQPAARDAGLERMHTLLGEVEAAPCPNPEAGPIDSTIAAGYPVYLFNRGTYYQQEGRRREAFYCYLGVAEKYARDLRTRAVARYSAASLLADGNKRGALGLVRGAISEALQLVERDPRALDPTLLAGMYELRRQLAGDLALYDEAVAAREEAQRLRAMVGAIDAVGSVGSVGAVGNVGDAGDEGNVP